MENILRAICCYDVPKYQACILSQYTYLLRIKLIQTIHLNCFG